MGYRRRLPVARQCRPSASGCHAEVPASLMLVIPRSLPQPDSRCWRGVRDDDAARWLNTRAAFRGRRHDGSGLFAAADAS